MYQKKLHIMCETTETHWGEFFGFFRLELQIYQFAFLAQLEPRVVSGTAGFHIHQNALNGPLASLLPHGSKVSNRLNGNSEQINNWRDRYFQEGREKYIGNKSKFSTK